MTDARDFGVLANGSDDTDAYNAALETAFLSGEAVSTPPGLSLLREATPGCGYMLLSKGVSIVGERTTFAPLPTVPNTADFIRWRPESGTNAEFRELSGFLIHPGRDGTASGCSLTPGGASIRNSRLRRPSPRRRLARWLIRLRSWLSSCVITPMYWRC